jgi:hypothetical protein
MNRVVVAMLAFVLAIGVAVSGAEAQKKKKAGGGKKAEAAAPASAQIAEAMTDVRWGMSKDQVLTSFIDKVKEKYRPLLAKTKDAVEEDRLRQEARQEVDKLRKGQVEFDGRSTGWDVSFLKGEFTHNNGESMLVVRDQNSQNFYFFMNGKLWKWFKAFDAEVFPAGNFAAFSGAVERKFGKAKQGQGELRAGEGSRQWLEWQDKQTRLRAVDQTGFYGFYCLVFEEKQTLDNLARLRSNDSGRDEKRHAMVESVTSQRSHNPDGSPNIVDRITGRIRQSEQAPESEPRAASGSSKTKSKDRSPASESTVSSSDDPISGLGL